MFHTEHSQSFLNKTLCFVLLGHTTVKRLKDRIWSPGTDRWHSLWCGLERRYQIVCVFENKHVSHVMFKRQTRSSSRGTVIYQFGLWWGRASLDVFFTPLRRVIMQAFVWDLDQTRTEEKQSHCAELLGSETWAEISASFKLKHFLRLNKPSAWSPEWCSGRTIHRLRVQIPYDAVASRSWELRDSWLVELSGRGGMEGTRSLSNQSRL